MTKQATSLGQKGEAAKAKLKTAARIVLERRNFHQIKIADVTGEAGVATGLFYRYFKDMNELLHELVEEFVARFEATEQIEAGVEKGDWFGRIHAHTRFIVSAYADQPGLMRCVYDMAGSDRELRDRWHDVQLGQLHPLVELMPRIFPAGETTAAQNELMVSALGSIGEGFLREYFVNRDEALTRHDYSEDELSEWLASLFYRALFGEDPPVERLNYSGPVTTLHRENK